MWLFLATQVYGQQYRSAQTVLYPPYSTESVDSFSTIPGSIRIEDPQGNPFTDSFNFDWVLSQISFPQPPKEDSLIVLYKTFSFRINQSFQLRDPQQIKDETIIEYETIRNQRSSLSSRTYNPGEELQKVGSISRGISFGNNQNLSVNSNLDLQVSGKLSKNYTLSAALSDQNIPIQPEGTTSSIQEFDQVYIKVNGNGSDITLGDFFMSNKSDDYFFKSYKKSQGIQALQTVKLENDKTVQIGATIGVARGQFARNTFQGQEGNQGPYRLSSESGQLFIIVVAGTEKVYINGKQLDRGEQNQYIIDYNSGEITFTPNQLITSLDRIVVEFQYADNSFERTLMHGIVEQKLTKSKWRVNFYQEQDNKNKPFYTTFTASDVLSLTEAGDDISLAFKSSADTANITENTITYLKKDSLANGVFFPEVYVQSNDKNLGIYRLTFSLVGANKGNYIASSSLVNGRVYEWVAPLGGIPQGNYEPVIQLKAPGQKRLITGMYESKIGQNWLIKTDIAFSKNDKNRFSELDSKDDDGQAAKLNLNFKDSVFKNKWVFENENYAEYSSANFEGIDRFRSVEFDRTWNRQISNTNSVNNQNREMLQAGTSFLFSRKNSQIQQKINGLQIPNFFSGAQSETNWSIKHEKIQWNGLIGYTTTDQEADSLSSQTGDFQRYSQSLSYDLKSLTLAVMWQKEHNRFFIPTYDSLLNSSFAYEVYGASISNPDTAFARFEFGVQKRQNKSSLKNYLDKESKSTDWISKLGIGNSPKLKIDLSTTYRQFDRQIEGEDSLDENTLLNRLEYRFSIAKGLVQTNSYYQIGTGRERQFEIIYLFVGDGQGDYVWSDLNENEQQDLGEFRPEEYNGQGSYIRSVVNNNDYVQAISNEFFQNLLINPAVKWAGKKGIRGFVGKFSNQTSGTIKRKTKDINQIDQFNPFSLDASADFLISANGQFRNSVYYNRLHAKMSLEYTFLDLINKNLFVYGFESQRKKEHLYQLRWNVGSSFTLFPSFRMSDQENLSEAFDEKNYSLKSQEIRLKSQWQKGQDMRLALHGEWNSSQGNAELETSIDRKLVGIEMTYSKALKGLISARLDFIQASFQGNKTSPIGFNMLSGLQPGQNLTWTIITNYQLSKQAQIGINYEGRYSETNKVIQTGSVNARWLF